MRDQGALAVAGRVASRRRPVAVLVFVLVVASVMPLGIPTASGLGVPVRVMPLGNSITRGVVGSTDNAGYRNDLYASLSASGYVVDMVGSQADGVGFDN